VAVSLSRFGLHSAFVTALPSNELGENALSQLVMHGVDTRYILRKGDRMGMYYLEHGSGPRPSGVIYDRSHSSITEITSKELDWDIILGNASWFHWSGITPALGSSVLESLIEGLKVAKTKGVTVSVDLNYRKKLWSEAKAKEVMTELMPFVDVMIGNEEDPIRVFNMDGKGTDFASGKLDLEGYRALTEELLKRFAFQRVAITLRESTSASENTWSACLFNGRDFFRTPRYPIWIVDRVGSGDAFAAGLIFGLLSGKSDADALSFGVGAACLKHSIRGDFNLVSAKEVERFVSGDTSGRVRR
jgi:2-dehydro-3-deoxygluconokinase